MSEATAKATRRELRRVLGPEDVGVVSQQQANLQAIAASLCLVDQRLGSLDRVTLESRVVMADRLARLEAFRHRGFWARLRWLVTGR